MKRVIIIGGNAASLSAASRVRKYHSNWDIIVYQKGEYISYGGCGIPYYTKGLVNKIDDLITLTPEDVINKRNIPLKLHHEAIEIDFENKEVLLMDHQKNKRFKDKYDFLFIGTGATPIFPKSFSINADHPRLIQVHSLQDAERNRMILDKYKGEIHKVIIVGLGFIGQEMLETYKKYGIEEIIAIEPKDIFTGKPQEIYLKELEKHNIKIISEFVKNISSNDDSSIKIELKNGKEILADLVQLSIGVRPNTDFLRNTNLDIDKRGAIIIDRYGRTNMENVYSGGDCALCYHQMLKKNVYIPLAPAANKLGKLAGIHISQIDTQPFEGIVGTAIWKVLDLYCAKTGLNNSEAIERGYDVDSIFITARENAHYYPGENRVHILLRFDKKSHKVLGCEIIAESPLGAKKVDVVATIITAGMSVEEMQDLDLSYAPPFAPVYDPLLIAANVAKSKLDKNK